MRGYRKHPETKIQECKGNLQNRLHSLLRAISTWDAKAGEESWMPRGKPPEGAAIPAPELEARAALVLLFFLSFPLLFLV